MTAVQVVCGDVTAVPCDALVVNLFEGVTAPGGATGAVDRALGGEISWLIQQGELRGAAGETVILHTRGRIAPLRVVVAGLGPAGGLDCHGVRAAAGLAARAALRAGARKVATIAHGAGLGGLDPGQAASSTVLGSILGTHRPAGHKTQAEAAGDPAALTSCCW